MRSLATTLIIKLMIILFSTYAYSKPRPGRSCPHRVSGMIKVQINNCTAVDPKVYFSNTRNIPFWVQEFDNKSMVVKAMGRHKGVLIEGTVTASEAVLSGMSQTQRHALVNETHKFFLPMSSNTSCQRFPFMGEVTGHVAQQCCGNDNLSTPCLFNTDLQIQQKPWKRSSAPTFNPRDMAQVYKRGKSLFVDGQMEKSIMYLERVHKARQLPVEGQVMLAAGYRAYDRCQHAIPLLQNVYRTFLRNPGEAPSHGMVVKGVTLLARCYALKDNPGQAVLVLGRFLHMPQRFQTQIRSSLNHADFGWINSSSEFVTYRKEALKALNRR